MAIDHINGNSHQMGVHRGNNGSPSPRADRAGDLTTTGPSAEESSVSLSDQANQLGRLEKEIQAAPDIDRERISEIRQALSDGTYKIDVEAIANRLLDQDDHFA